MALVKFYTCTQNAYTNLETKSEGSLYFTTDTKRLYKGNTLYGGSFEYCTELPVSGNTGTLYFSAQSNKISIWNGTAFEEKFLPYSTTLSDSSTDSTVPTSKTVYDAIGAEKTKRSADDQVLSGAIDIINGTDSTNGSIAKAVKDAKDLLSGSIGEGFSSSSTVKAAIEAEAAQRGADDQVLSGAISGEVLAREADTEFLSGAIGEGFSSENTVKAAIEAVQTAAISISGTAENAVKVTGDGTAKTVSLKINDNDRFLTQTDAGLSATVTLVKKAAAELTDAENNAAEYYLADKNGAQVGATINIPKDQFLENVEFVEGTGSKDDKLRFTFTVPSGSQVLDVDLSGLFNEYTAGGGISLNATSTGIEISGVVDTSNNADTFLTVGANGFRLQGVQTAINTGDEALSAAIGEGFGPGDGETVKDYISSNIEALSTAIGEGFGPETTNGTVSAYIYNKIDGLTTSMTTGLSTKLDDVTATSGEIIIAKGDGKVKASGDFIGGSTIAAVPTANTVATEIAVSSFVDSKITDALSAALVWNTL